MGKEKTLEDLFANLISNALEYPPKDGIVMVSLFGQGRESALFEVGAADIGMHARDQSRLFTESFGAENAKASGVEGTGLGLAIGKEILDRLGGSVMVKSESGKGSRFSYLIPAAPAAAQKGQAE